MKEDVQHPHGTLQRLAGVTSRPFQDLCKIYQRSATSLHFSDTLENEWTWGWTPESDKFQGISFSVRGPWWGSMFVFVVNRTYVLYSILYQGDGARASGQIKSKVHTSRHFLPPKSMNNSGYLNHTACEDQVIISPNIKKTNHLKSIYKKPVIRVQESWTQVEKISNLANKHLATKMIAKNQTPLLCLELGCPHPCLLFHVC